MSVETDWIGATGQWASALASTAAVIAALWIATSENRRRNTQDIRHQAEQMAAWLEIDAEKAEETGWADCVVQNNSGQLVYDVVISLVGVHGTYRRTAVKPDRSARGEGCQTYVGGPFPPGRRRLPLGFHGHFLQVRYGVELAFTDAAGRYWIRHANGFLEEVGQAPLVLYGSGPPGPGPGSIEIFGRTSMPHEDHGPIEEHQYPR